VTSARRLQISSWQETQLQIGFLIFLRIWTGNCWILKVFMHYWNTNDRSTNTLKQSEAFWLFFKQSRVEGCCGPPENPDGAFWYQQALRQLRAFSSQLQISPLIASLNAINLVLSPKADRWKQCEEITASQHSRCIHCPQQSGNFSHASNKNKFIGIWHHPSSS